MKGQDKSQKVVKLKSEIEEREKALFYKDSWEQTGQIRVDIEKWLFVKGWGYSYMSSPNI